MTVAWDFTAEFILTASGKGYVDLWNLRNGNRFAGVSTGHRTAVHSVEWTDEGAYAIACSSDHLRVMDGSCMHPGWLKKDEDRFNERNQFTAASCSRQTTLLLAIASESGAVLNLVNLVTAMLVSTVRLMQPVRALAWSPVTELLAAATDRGILLFRATPNGLEGEPRRLTADAVRVQAVAFSSDGRLLGSRDAKGLKFWSIEDAKLVTALDEDSDVSGQRPGPGIAFHPSKPLLATSHGTVLRILDVSKLV
jgi:WD40 repeat protein